MGLEGGVLGLALWDGRLSMGWMEAKGQGAWQLQKKLEPCAGAVGVRRMWGELLGLASRGGSLCESHGTLQEPGLWVMGSLVEEREGVSGCPHLQGPHPWH